MQLSANFSNLQSEYDNAQDTIEALRKESADVNKDLQRNIQQYTETKLKLDQSETELKQAKNVNLEYEGKVKENEQQITSLKSRLSEQVNQ